MANTFSLTAFTSRVLATFLIQKSPFIATSYQGIDEFTRRQGYGIGDTVNIKLPGYPPVQTGLSVTASDITDQTAAYVNADIDIYNVTREVDIRRLETQIVGNKIALVGNPGRNPNNPGEMNPQAKMFIDNYVYPAGIVIKAAIETRLGDKARAATAYTPIDTPASLGSVNSYSDISAVDALMDELGWPSNRLGVMNTNDAKNVADSLQNMFNETINENITRNARLGGPDKGRLANIDIYRSNVLSTTQDSLQFANPTELTVKSVATDGSSITFEGSTLGVTVDAINVGTMISIPSVNWIGQASKKTIATKLVVTAAADADVDGAGEITILLGTPLVAVGDQANVNAIPANGASTDIFAGHNNNYFYVPMGIIANALPLTEIYGADNSKYSSDDGKMSNQTYVQGLVTSGVNTFRMSCLMPTLAIGRYLINLPSALT